MDATPAPQSLAKKLFQQAGFKPGFVVSGAMGKMSQKKRHFHEVKVSKQSFLHDRNTRAMLFVSWVTFISASKLPFGALLPQDVSQEKKTLYLATL
ncbi:hypothetical protein ABMA77_07400 [Halobacteriovorax sp. RZ-1]|uniref:hypothetical protein n=1 Tax=unclassified Halobacteriovorax TaxID=2639665 RepID=UPI003721B7F6